MATPLGQFIRAKRDATRPESVGLRVGERRRAPGLRRSELADRAGISVEYLVRIEQGRDRRPSSAVLDAVADGLALDLAEREHLRYLAKITGGACAAHPRPGPPHRTVRPTVRRTLELLEPGVAMVTNRLGDVLAHTSGFAAVMRASGLLEAEQPNLTRYTFTDRRARSFFPDWEQVADEQAFDLWLGPTAETSEWFTAELAPLAGAEFTRRLGQHMPPSRVPHRIHHPAAGELVWLRETLRLSSTDAQEIVVYLPADAATARSLERLLGAGALHAVR